MHYSPFVALIHELLTLQMRALEESGLSTYDMWSTYLFINLFIYLFFTLQMGALEQGGLSTYDMLHKIFF